VYAGACLVGPHRDDLQVSFGNRDLRSFGSSGQQRSALITLDLAAISVYHSSIRITRFSSLMTWTLTLDETASNAAGISGRTQSNIPHNFKESHFERFSCERIL